MDNSSLSKKIRLGVLIDTVRRSEWIKNRPILDTVLNNPLVDDYFQRDLGSDHVQDASFEKKIAVTAAKFASEHLGFDREKSVKVATTAADLVRDTRRIYQYQQKKISEQEYNKHKEVSWWARVKGVGKALWEAGKEKVKSWVAEKGISALIKHVAKVIPNPVVQVVTHVWDMIPQPIKTVVKEGAKKLAKKAVEAIPVVAEKVWETSKTVAKTVGKVIEKGVEKAIEVGRKVVEVAKPIIETAKNIASKAWESVKSVGKKALAWLGF